MVDENLEGASEESPKEVTSNANLTSTNTNSMNTTTTATLSSSHKGSNKVTETHADISKKSKKKEHKKS